MSKFKSTSLEELVITTPEKLKNTVLEALKEAGIPSVSVSQGNPLATNKPLDTEEAAIFLGMSVHTIRQYAKDGRIPSQKRGRKYIFFEQVLLDWKAGKFEKRDSVKEEVSAIKKSIGRRNRYGK